MINQISYILHRSTSQLGLQLLSLPPLLPQPQSDSEYPQHTSTRSEGGTFFATSEGANNSVNNYTTSNATASHITCIGSISKSIDQKNYKVFEVSSDSQSQENTGGAPVSSTPFTPIPTQLQKTFCTQEAQHLVANHLFNLPHHFQIFNKQGGKETIDNLLLVMDSDTW